ncbi:MAG: hypothetical protein EHM79_02200 [Geobacter sp.]|nr:MAG: hypothetical protein EHM79_02200 [Geobacter sp.]
MSKRQQIVDAIETRMKTILTTGGYATNAGRNVFDWRITPIPETELPAICIYDGDCAIDYEETPVGLQGHFLIVDLVSDAKGSAARADVRKINADVVKAIGTDLTWGGLAVDTDLISHGLNMEQGDKPIGAGIVRIKIYYRTPLWEL